LRVENTSKSFGGTLALDHLSLEVFRGEVHALVGENGSGKSTFIKILAGYHHPDPGGTIRVDDHLLAANDPDASYDLGCRFVHQELGLVGSETVMDNFAFTTGYPRHFGTIRPKRLRREIELAFERLELNVNPRRTVNSLTPAERSGVAIARALYVGSNVTPKLMVFDEPTATLPADEVQRLMNIIRSVALQGVGVIYVTHRLDELFGNADRVSVLRDGRLIATENVDVIDHRQLVTMLVGRELDSVRAQVDTLTMTEGSTLSVRDLSVEGLHGVSFTVSPGEILGISGITGSGREVILPAIFGAVHRSEGQIVMRGVEIPANRPDISIRSGMGYLPVDRAANSVVGTMSVRENLTLASLKKFWNRFVFSRSAERDEVNEWLVKLEVRPPDCAERSLQTLSGGNQQKVIFAKWLRLKPALMLFDEPTQGVDVGAKSALHKEVIALAQGSAAIVVASSDIDELVALCTRILILRDGQFVQEFRGDLHVAEVTSSTIAQSDDLRGAR
jgi:ribose transport system ATP-binding protein